MTKSKPWRHYMADSVIQDHSRLTRIDVGTLRYRDEYNPTQKCTGSRQIIFISFLLPMGQHLETWKIPSVKARMIRQARGVGEACERLLFRQTFWFEQACRQILRDSRSQGEKECSSSQCLSFSFSYIWWKYLTVEFVLVNFFQSLPNLRLKSRREFVHTNKKEKIIEPQIDKKN